MPIKKHKPEQIVTLLRQIEAEIANGKTTPQACRDAQITGQTYYRWRKEYGGLKLDQARTPSLSPAQRNPLLRVFELHPLDERVSGTTSDSSLQLRLQFFQFVQA